VVMGAGFGIGSDGHGTSPEFRGSSAGVRDGSLTGHTRCLRCIGIQRAGSHNLDPMLFPVHVCIVGCTRKYLQLIGEITVVAFAFGKRWM
jgi:hypothetical protein